MGRENHFSQILNCFRALPSVFLALRVPRPHPLLTHLTIPPHLRSWLVADTQGKHARLSCSLDAAHAHPLSSCRQSFISGSRTSDTIHHLKYLICNLEQITSYGWLVLTTIFRWLILTVFDSNDCKQILSGGESIIPRCSSQGFWVITGCVML